MIAAILAGAAGSSDGGFGQRCGNGLWRWAGGRFCFISRTRGSKAIVIDRTLSMTTRPVTL